MAHYNDAAPTASVSWSHRLALSALACLVLALPAAAQVVDFQFGSSGTGDGQFIVPFGVAKDASGNYYVSDAGNQRIQKFDASGTFVGWAGRCTGNLKAPPFDDCDVTNQRSKGFRCTASTCTGSGAGTLAGQFNYPSGVTVRGDKLYVADTENDRVQIIDLVTLAVTTVGSFGTLNGQFDAPLDVTADSSGNLYVADAGNDRIQKLTSGGAFLAQIGVPGTGQGELADPRGIALDPSDNLYVADYGNDRIQKFSASGTFLTVIGSAGTGAGQLDGPADVVVDKTTGQIIVGELGNERVQIFDAAGAFTKMMGYGVQNGAAVFQVCTHDCEAGVGGTGVGQFRGTSQVTLGSIVVTAGSNGKVIVIDTSSAAAAVCGNGVTETGEVCDGDASTKDCCATNCDYEATGFTCRAAAADCDAAEVCTGASATCPVDKIKPTGATCRAAAGACDVAEVCDGASPTCPRDTPLPWGTTCRAAAGDCDVAETCTGLSTACPADTLKASGTLCRASAGVCDLPESCTGSSAACPTDSYFPSTVTCRVAAGDCDVAETCTGSGAACPANGFATSGTTCRASAGDCDVAETCSGSSAACPTDAFKPSTTKCRQQDGLCDVSETCTGASAACPTDKFVAAGTTCRAESGVCDVAEVCTGFTGTCPSDAPAPEGATCDDGVFCNGADTCGPIGSSSRCSVHAGDPCPGGGTCSDACDETADACTAVRAAGTSCASDGNACTTDVCGADEVAWLGFTAGTGGSTSNHDIVSWTVQSRGVSYPTFASTAGMNLVGAASGTGSALRLTTDAGGNAAGAAWYTTPLTVGDGFDTTFAFQLSGAGRHADGFAFVIQNSGAGASVLGDVGGGLGYAGIIKSLAVEFDTFQNADEPSDSFVSVQTRYTAGNSSAQSASLGWAEFPTMEDGNVHTARILYKPGKLSIYLDGAGNPSLTVLTDLSAIGLGTTGSGTCEHAAGNAGAVCRAANGLCDVAETCTGSSVACPSDGFASTSTTCRASAGACDVAETCGGDSAACPDDEFESSGTTCRESAGDCDPAEVCSGSSASCPSDALATSDTLCRAADVCDVAEYCTGSDASCPENELAAEGTACDDGIFCNGSDTCGASGTGCSEHPGDPCPGADGDGDCAETCDEAADACSAPDEPGTTCDDDGNACTTDVCGGDGMAWLGFTAGTGGQTSNHDILAWSVAHSGIAYEDFASTAGLTLRGRARGEGGALRLTGDDDAENLGVAWAATALPVTSGFDTTFSFRISGDGPQADGFAFVIQGDDARATGEPGSSLGYAGIDHSVAIEFDTFQNDGEPSGAFVSVQFAGEFDNSSEHSASLGSVDVPSLEDGNVHTARVVYVPGTLEVYLDGAVDPDLTVPFDLTSLALETAASGTCEHAPGNPGVVCRGASGACDVEETCTGTSTSCPADAYVAADTTCRAAEGDCDVAETCTGDSSACPADGYAAADTSCRAALSACDVAEVCTGDSRACPDDVIAAAGTTCRAAAGACDVAETCSGDSAVCPDDAFVAAETTCRAATGACDVAESCSGSAAECPSDGYASSDTTCRGATDACDTAEHCSGSGAGCPEDVVLPAGASCDDGLFCNGADTCGAVGAPSRCSEHAGDPCAAGNTEASCAESCDEGHDDCSAPDPAGSACTDDGNACTTDLCGDRPGVAWVGFTAGSSPTETSTHEILSWSVAGSAVDYSALEMRGPADVAAGVLRVGLDDVPNTTASAWSTTPLVVESGLDTTFTFRITGDGAHGNGFAFVVQAVGSGVRGTKVAGGLGYSGVPNSIAVAFDTVQHAGEPSDAFVTVQTRGTAGNTTDPSASLGSTSFPSMKDGNVHTARIVYASGLLRVYLDGELGITASTTLTSIGLATESGTCLHDAGNAGDVCRAADGVCDVAEACDGTSSACPSDGFVAGGTTCRASAGACDVAETCTGSGGDCPVDAFQPTTFACRAAAGECDQAESCSGTDATCPADEKRPDGTACAADGNPCSRDVCDGASDVCLHPAGNAGAVCRAPSSGNVCDVAEVCSGGSLVCPADTGVADTDADGLCDGQDACTKSGGGGTFLASSKPKLMFTRVNTDPVGGNDKLLLKGAFNLPAGTPFSAVDPLTNGARIVVLNAAGEVRFDVTLPGGPYAGAGTRGWKASGSPATKHQYYDKTGTPLGGITKLQVLDASAREPGQVKVMVVGTNGTYPVVTGDDPVETIVVLGGAAASNAGHCGETAFVPNDCAYNGKGNKLTCKQ